MSDTGNVVHLPGTTLTPEVVLARTQGKLRRIKAVAVVIQWDDETMDVDWSQMKASELTMAAACLTHHANRTLFDGENTFEARR